MQELTWAAKIMHMHADDQCRVFRGMDEDKYDVFVRRSAQVRAIQDVGWVMCKCNRCGGKCPGKFRVGSSQLVCYDCTFGNHRGVSSTPNPTLTTEKRHDVTRTETRSGAPKGAHQSSVPPVARRTHLRIKRRSR